jgi:hypothetical protein
VDSYIGLCPSERREAQGKEKKEQATDIFHEEITFSINSSLAERIEKQDQKNKGSNQRDIRRWSSTQRSGLVIKRRTKGKNRLHWQDLSKFRTVRRQPRSHPVGPVQADIVLKVPE